MNSIISKTRLLKRLTFGLLVLSLLTFFIPGFQSPLQAAILSRPLFLSESHLAVWNIHNVRPNEVFREKKGITSKQPLFP